MFLSQGLSSICSQIGTGAGTLEEVIKEREGAEQLGWPGIFLYVVSEPVHVVSPHGLVWASSQHDSL